MKKFSIKIFIMICFCVVLPFTVLCNYIKDNMEHFLQEQISDKVLENLSRDERNIYEELQQMAFFSNSLNRPDKSQHHFHCTFEFSEISAHAHTSTLHRVCKTQQVCVGGRCVCVCVYLYVCVSF